MKTSYDPRHQRRVDVMKDIFAWGFQPSDEPKTTVGVEIFKNLAAIDKEIEQSASNRPLNQINRIDLAILRLAIFELTIEKNSPYKVIVDEAIELAKEFGADSSPSFINGVLGNVIEKYHLDKK